MTQIISNALDIQEFVPSTELEPTQAHFMQYEADSSSLAGTSWFINSPGKGALLDSEAYIEYTLSFKDGDVVPWLSRMFARRSDALCTNRLALRQGLVMANAMQNITLNLNTVVINENPDRWNSEIMRFYATPSEMNSIVTMSGGELDEGSFTNVIPDDFCPKYLFDAGQGNPDLLESNRYTAPGYTDITRVQAQDANSFGIVRRNAAPMNDRTVNMGFTKRFMRFSDWVRQGGSNNDADGTTVANTAYGGGIGTTNEMSIKIWERIPIAPFMMWEMRNEKRSIPNIDKMMLRISWNSNAKNMILCGYGRSLPNAGIIDYSTGLLRTEKDNFQFDFTGNSSLARAAVPRLHLKWYIPPPGIVATMKPSYSLPITEIKFDTRNVASFSIDIDKIVSPEKNVTFNNIRLEQFPDLLMIYLAPDNSVKGFEDPTEFHCEIQSLDISVDGDAGKLIQASSGELFAMYVRNAANKNFMKHNYEDWRKRYCTVAIRPSDLGLRQGPGINHPITLNIRVTFRSWWNIPHMKLVAPGNEGEHFYGGESKNLWSRNDEETALFKADVGGLPRPSLKKDVFMYVISQYERYELTLTANGGGNRKLLSLAPPSSVAVPGFSSGLAGLV